VSVLKQAAIIGVILENPQKSQETFNNVVSEYHEIIQGRMGIPFQDGAVALVSLTVVSDTDIINTFTERIASIDGAHARASITRTK
jgi:putative iron-only hydrogenase system regulator